MTRTLSLVRHAKSSWGYPGLDDWDRPLNKRGLRDAEFMAARYAAEYTPDLIVTSYANRALTTARVFARRLDYPVERLQVSEKIYEAGVDELLLTICAIANQFRHVALFGHNPGLVLLCNQLRGFPFEKLPTSGIVVFEFDTDQWVDMSNSRMIKFDYPKKSMVIRSGEHSS